jgi:hypothetical protein
MVAASVWSLLIPAMEQAVTIGQLQFIRCHRVLDRDTVSPDP